MTGVDVLRLSKIAHMRRLRLQACALTRSNHPHFACRVLFSDA